MPRILPEYERSTVYALIGAILHFLLLALIFFFEFMGLGGENSLSWLVSFWNWPLWLLVLSVDVFRISNEFFIWYVGGTFLAAAEGWIVGAVVDAFLDWRLKNRGF